MCVCAVRGGGHLSQAAKTGALDGAVKEALEAEQHARAASLIVEGLGPEILGWLHAVTRAPDVAEEIFSGFASALWTALPRFRGDSSVRTWAYAIARNVQLKHARGERRARVADAPLSELEAKVRTDTRPYLKTDVKDRFARARARLMPDERALLVLRVDREMAWTDIALVLTEEPLEGAALRSRAATLRKRFERLKDELRRTAEREGWI